jgi:outer membrane receptor protein involved in Fe transport
MAQGADAPRLSDEPGSYGDIVVTAQKRSERLADVGITIVAATSAQLKNAGVAEVTDLPKIAPGLTTGVTFGGYALFSLRGVNFNTFQIAAPPAVSAYIDEAPLPYTSMTAGLLLDVERVEVLKGPQGTLFGQNATGGSINVIAAKPTSVLSAGGNLEVNNFGQVMLEGFVSGPISDTLRLRLAGTTTQFGAWQRGYFANGQKNGDQNRAAARLLVDWTPTDRLKIGLNLSTNYDHSEMQQFQLALVSPANPASAPPGLINYPLPNGNRDADFQLGFDTHAKSRQYQAVGRIEYELSDQAAITSITSYIDTKLYRPFDFDGTAVDNVRGSVSGTVKTFVQELRLTGSTDVGLSYILGGNYQKDKIFDRNTTIYTIYSTLPPGTLLDSRYNLTNKAAGVFANLEYQLSDNLKVTAGARYTKTRQAATGCLFGNGPTAATFGFIASLFKPGVESAYVDGGCLTINNVGQNPDYLPIFADISQKEDNVSWRIGLNYKIDNDSLVYALVSRGYKSGTFPLSFVLLQSIIRNLRQEELTSYEVGTKLSLFEKALQFNVSGFYYDYRDKQFATYEPVPPIGPTQTLVNIPKSKVKGIEVEAVVHPIRALELRGAVTYIKTEVGQFTGFSGTLLPVDFTGKEFNFAPPLTATFDAEYRMPISAEIEGYVGFGGSYNNRTFSDLGENPQTRIPARTLLDARIGIQSEGTWRLGAWVRNLTNKTYWTTTANGGDTQTRFAGMPRTFGLSAGYRF